MKTVHDESYQFEFESHTHQLRSFQISKPAPPIFIRTAQCSHFSNVLSSHKCTLYLSHAGDSFRRPLAILLMDLDRGFEELKQPFTVWEDEQLRLGHIYFLVPHPTLSRTHSKCLADLCGALHCDAVIYSKTSKTKCNPAASGRNRHLCESLTDSCFPLNGGSSASRLHECFCTNFVMPTPAQGNRNSSLGVAGNMKSRAQELQHITKVGRKTKPS